MIPLLMRPAAKERRAAGMGALVVQLKGEVSAVLAASEESISVELEWYEQPKTVEIDAETTIA